MRIEGQEPSRRRFLTTAGAALASPHAWAGERPRSRVSIAKGEIRAEVVDNHDGVSGKDQVAMRYGLPLPAEREQGRHWSKQLYCTVPRRDRFNGYNGLSSLRQGDTPSPFLVCCSGLNCEFIFDAEEATFEPRWLTGDKPYIAGPSSLERLGSDRARIIIEPGSRWGVRVEMVHQLIPPYFVDTTYRITPTLEQVLGPWLGLFWASYLQTPYATFITFEAAPPGKA